MNALFTGLSDLEINDSIIGRLQWRFAYTGGEASAHVIWYGHVGKFDSVLVF
jgi:hypothetical protein